MSEINIRNVYGIGETVYDIIFKDGQPIAGKPGGSILNCMVSLGRCGVNASFISEIGKDQIGDIIIKFLESNNLSGKYINRFADGKSSLALAFLDKANDADYDFYIHNPKKRLDIKLPDLKKDDIVIFGSFFALNAEVHPIVKRLLEQAKEVKAIVYYDPNIRSSILHKLVGLMPTFYENLDFASIFRGSDEDFRNLFGKETINTIYQKVKPYCSTIIRTANKGSINVLSGNHASKYRVPEIEPVSTIGAGDNFNAGFIYGLVKNEIGYDDLHKLSDRDWSDLIERAISFSAEVCLSYDNYVSYDFAKSLSQM